MIHHYEGIQNSISENWFEYIPLQNHKEIPINYLEIGTYYGANIFSVGRTYGNHPDSKLHCINADPYRNYNDYPKYIGKPDYICLEFEENLKKSIMKDKIITHYGRTNVKIPRFENKYFDIIYISSYYGNGMNEHHDILQDAILCFPKLKDNGYMIVDDYDWGESTSRQREIDEFLNACHDRIEILGHHNTQLFVQKVNKKSYVS